MKNTLLATVFFFLIAFAFAQENPAMPDFDLKGSDPKAIELADKVMAAMGGRNNWDNTQYICWNFFGSRYHIWNKWTGDVRIKYLRMDREVIFNINTMSGQVKDKGESLSQADSVSKYVKQAHAHWVNDSYWLVMPFKLKDSGVTLQYKGKTNTQAGAEADVIELTFKAVGYTPQNKYLVYVDPATQRVIQWDFFRNATDEKPGITNPWTDYAQYGKILLSGGRGPRGLTEIKVPETVPAHTFKNFEPVKLD